MLGKEALLVQDVVLPTMNLVGIDEEETKITSEERGLILHQFGHVLGMVHEHPGPSGSGKDRSGLLDVEGQYA